MLSNYSIASNPELLKEIFHLEHVDPFDANYNVQPTQALPVITSNRPDQSLNFHWGITSGFTKNKSVSEKLLYAPSAQLATKATLRDGLMHKRCVILADGFYTWKNIAKKEAIPYRSCLPNNYPFAMAGIWNQYTNENDEAHHTFMIIRTETKGPISEYTPVAPLILNEDLMVEWLNPSIQDDSLLDFLGACHHNDFTSYTVNPKLSDPKFNEASLWEKVPPANQFGNLTLFN